MTLTAADLRARAWELADRAQDESGISWAWISPRILAAFARLLRDACASCPDPGHKARLRYVADELEGKRG